MLRPSDRLRLNLKVSISRRNNATGSVKTPASYEPVEAEGANLQIARGPQTSYSSQAILHRKARGHCCLRHIDNLAVAVGHTATMQSHGNNMGPNFLGPSRRTKRLVESGSLRIQVSRDDALCPVAVLYQAESASRNGEHMVA